MFQVLFIMDDCEPKLDQYNSIYFYSLDSYCFRNLDI